MKIFAEKSIPALFQNQVKKLGDRACVSVKVGEKLENISWNQMNAYIRQLAIFLIKKGVKKGDAIAIFSENRYEWWVADQAILSIGALDVPIYATNSAEEARYILDHSDSIICFVGTKEHLDNILQVRDGLRGLKHIISFNNLSDGGAIPFRDALIEGGNSDVSIIDKKIDEIAPDDPATYIYTSGTTGNPKGVILTHNNFVTNVKQCHAVFEKMMKPEGIFLSFLPLSHSLERTVGYYFAVYAGATVAFAESFQKILQDFTLVRPDVIISVPRLYEKMHAGVLAKANDAPFVKKMLFKYAIRIAAKNVPYVCNDCCKKGLFSIQYNILDKIIFSKLKAALGMDRIIVAISGGGPLSVSDAEFFLGMGIKIHEGFGLTETTPVTNVNIPGKIKVGTVGPALPDTVINISDEGEILIKGPQVMKGYFKDQGATDACFTADGFFKTGDIGMIDEDGYLSITDRIKDIIVTAGGKNISPQNIENCLKASPLIEQAAVIGDRRKYLSALIVPSIGELKKWALKNSIEFKDMSDLINNDRVVALFRQEIAFYTKDFARVEQIKKFKLLKAEWSQETGELTPKQSVKRRVIELKYAAEIESIYSGDD